jgi:hypothetical protein
MFIGIRNNKENGEKGFVVDMDGAEWMITIIIAISTILSVDEVLVAFAHH